MRTLEGVDLRWDHETPTRERISVAAIQSKLCTTSYTMAARDVNAMAMRPALQGRDGPHKTRAACGGDKRPKSWEETPNEGSDSESEGTEWVSPPHGRI
jgi:hypothetical protein